MVFLCVCTQSALAHPLPRRTGGTWRSQLARRADLAPPSHPLRRSRDMLCAHFEMRTTRSACAKHIKMRQSAIGRAILGLILGPQAEPVALNEPK